MIRFDYQREAWQDPKNPVVGGAAFAGWKAMTRIVLHYPGADWADMDFNNDGKIDLADTRLLLRNTQAAYVDTRGYSLGYNAAVGQEGSSWEIRGDTWMCAANGSVQTNRDAFAILIIVDAQSRANDDQIRKVRDVVAQARMLAGKNLPIIGHGDLKATTCPGAGIRAQMSSGVFEPQPEPSEVDMIITRWSNKPDRLILWSPLGWRYLTTQHDINVALMFGAKDARKDPPLKHEEMPWSRRFLFGPKVK